MLKKYFVILSLFLFPLSAFAVNYNVQADTSIDGHGTATVNGNTGATVTVGVVSGSIEAGSVFNGRVSSKITGLEFVDEPR